MTITVLSTRPLPLPELSARGEPIRILPVGSDEASAAEALLSTALDPVDAATIGALPPGIGLIANFGIGTDNIDIAAAHARGIKVSNTPMVAEDTADLAFALILTAMRRVAEADRFVRSGRWQAAGGFGIGTRVHGARLALAGFGAIGQAVARRAAGFGMDISYWARSPRSEAESSGARFVADLDTLMGEADILSLHLPLTAETRHLFDADRLAKARDGLVLINTGRGALIDEEALVRALANGRIAAAGLDVFEAEPAVHPALLAMEQVVLTPHIGSATGACHADMARRAIGNLIAFLETGTPLDPVG